MKNKAVLAITLVQILSIGFLINNIVYKKNTALRATSVNPIKKSDITFSPIDSLKYFYEPVVSSNSAQFETIQYSARHNINTDALNDRYDYSVQKPDSTYRIITLGDSFTYGLHVNTKDNWTELLEDKLNTEMKCSNIKKFEVINLGVGGYDNQYSLERYKKRGAKYNPDLVIWYQVDMMRYREEDLKLIDENFKKAETEPGMLHDEYLKGNYNPIFDKSEQELIKKIGEKNLLKFQVDEIKKLRDYYKGPLVLSLNPSIHELTPSYEQFIKDNLKVEKNVFVFTPMSFDSFDSKLIFSDHHPNEEGHKIIAGDVFNYLKNNKITSCN